MPKIKFCSENREITIASGEEFLRLYERDNTLPLKFGCRKGNCGVCALLISSGKENLSRKSANEQETLKKKGLFKEEHRLACQCAINGDVTVVT